MGKNICKSSKLIFWTKNESMDQATVLSQNQTFTAFNGPGKYALA